MNETPIVAPKEYPTGKKELLFGGGILVSALLLCNFTLFGGFHLGFAIGSLLCILCSSLYLHRKQPKAGIYPRMILFLCAVIAASFARSDDVFVKFVMFCFLTVGTNLGLCLLAGQQRRNPGRPGTLADAFFTAFQLGFGELPPAYRGLSGAFRRSGPTAQKSTAILAGLGISIPILAIMVPLLVFSDAAFEGLVDQLPDFSFSEIILTVLFGVLLAFVLYTRGAALMHYQNKTPNIPQKRKGLACLTINTVLCAVCLLYVLYLLSQLAYFVGGFSGILPKGYTLAQYARRGFFEIAWLCAINLGIIALSLALNREKNAKSTKFFCLFIALVTLFLVATASAKMFLYIESYGLTRRRVLTQVILLFLALTTGLVAVRLFLPRLPYMKTVILAGLLLGALVSWMDVDSFVAKHNVDAYLSGKLDTVDVSHLSNLSSGAVPHIYRLSQEATNSEVVEMAEDTLQSWWLSRPEDFRGWNYANHIAANYLPKEEAVADREYLP